MVLGKFRKGDCNNPLPRERVNSNFMDSNFNTEKLDLKVGTEYENEL